MRRSPLRPALAAALVVFAGALQAQAWPTHPVKLIVPFPPGGGTDTFARPLAAKLGEQLGQQIILDNRGGAGGTRSARRWPPRPTPTAIRD